MSEIQQAQFSGWARVEVMGHQAHIGFVRTEAYGQAVLFRIDTPELPEREYELARPEWCGEKYCPVGTKVKREAEPGVSVLIGAGSIYRIVPCTEAVAREAIEASRRTNLKLVSLPAEKMLEAATAVSAGSLCPATGLDQNVCDCPACVSDDKDPYEDNPMIQANRRGALK